MDKPNIHPYTDADGSTRYAVATWNGPAGEWQAPLDKNTRRATGCRREFAKRLQNMRTFGDLAQAKRYAKRVFGYAHMEEV